MERQTGEWETQAQQNAHSRCKEVQWQQTHWIGVAFCLIKIVNLPDCPSTLIAIREQLSRL